MAKFNRTHNNGELRLSDVGKTVTLAGWVQKNRNLGGLIFIDLRDRHGITQIVCRPENKENYAVLETVKNEYVLQVTGNVIERESKNKNIPTGDIEIDVTTVNVLSEALQPPMIIADKTDALEDFRMKYRYLDLRRPVMQKNLMMRHQITRAVREFFDENGFVDIETPTFGKSTPEGARDYLVPSRVHPGKFYALPQSPQLYKQLLMVAGFERYYQIARCYRDEDLRADRQMEFTQIDVEMSFVDERDVHEMLEGMMKNVFKKVLNRDLVTPFPYLSFDEAMERYGCDKPDTRFGMELKNIEDAARVMGFSVFDNLLSEKDNADMSVTQNIINPNEIKAICVKGGSEKYSRKPIDAFAEYIKQKFKASGLAWFKYDGESYSGSIGKFINEEAAKLLNAKLNIEAGDLVLVVAGKKNVVNASLSYLRNTIAKEMNLYDEDQYNFLWLVDWPSFEWSEEENRWVAAHHPFTMPKDEWKDKLLTEPEHCYSKCYDLVLNGLELGSGSIRIHEQKVQSDMFKAIGLSEEEASEKFGFFVEALKYGTPPHGGIALGLDRLAMIFAHAQSLREVIAFPKTASATCLMSDAPSFVDDVQLKDLHIAVTEKEK